MKEKKRILLLLDILREFSDRSPATRSFLGISLTVLRKYHKTQFGVV